MQNVMFSENLNSFISMKATRVENPFMVKYKCHYNLEFLFETFF
jgi:hypothetical protein